MSNIINQIKELSGKFVTIGIHGDKGEQKKIIRLEPAGKKLAAGKKRETINQNLTLATVAQWNEFGNSKIPARSFLRSVLHDNRKKIDENAKIILKKRPDIFFETIGQSIVNMIQKKISEGVPPPNKPATIARKGSSKPLVDTGQLRTSITFKVSSND